MGWCLVVHSGYSIKYSETSFSSSKPSRKPSVTLSESQIWASNLCCWNVLALNNLLKRREDQLVIFGLLKFLQFVRTDNFNFALPACLYQIMYNICFKAFFRDRNISTTKTISLNLLEKSEYFPKYLNLLKICSTWTTQFTLAAHSFLRNLECLSSFSILSSWLKTSDSGFVPKIMTPKRERLLNILENFYMCMSPQFVGR